MQDWDSLKFRFRESLKRLDEISNEASLISRDQSIESAPQEEFNDLCRNFDSQSSECDQTLERMSRYAKASKSDRTTTQAQVDRFREMLVSCRQQWIRIKSSIQEEYRRRELLDQTFQAKDSSNIHSTLFEERNVLVRSIGMVDESIDQAFSANELLRRQSASISGFTEKLANITSHVPGINSILSRINNRQFQEKIIISLVLGACISILIWMRLLR